MYRLLAINDFRPHQTRLQIIHVVDVLGKYILAEFMILGPYFFPAVRSPKDAEGGNIGIKEGQKWDDTRARGDNNNLFEKLRCV